MKKLYILALALTLSISAAAQTQVMRVTLNNGSSQTFHVGDIAEITFGEETPAQKLAGEYFGTNTLAVGSVATYNVDITPEITANEDGTINLSFPEYDIPNTMMGNLTLGAITLSNIPYDEAENAFFLDYSNAGLKQHFKCITPQGVASMDSDYTLGTGSSVKIEVTEDGIKITNPFKLGAMPFPLSATFEGKKKEAK